PETLIYRHTRQGILFPSPTTGTPPRKTQSSSLRHPRRPNGTPQQGAAGCHLPAAARLRCLDLERARRRPTRLHVSEVECIELRPQDVALITQRLDHEFLFAACVRVLKHVVKSKLRVFRSLLKPSLDIIQSTRA